jgi:hypothetical protein
MFRDAVIVVHRDDLFRKGEPIPLEMPQIFSVVDPSRYDDHPRFEQQVRDFDELGDEEIVQDVQRFGTLGFGANYQTAWGDTEGLNLQQRARGVELL